MFFCKLRDIIPVALERISDVVCGLRVTEFQNGIVVKRPVLCLLVLSPDLLTFDAEDLHANATRGGRVVRNDLRCERRVAHNDIVYAGLLKHALSEVLGQLVVDDELAHNALQMVLGWL